MRALLAGLLAVALGVASGGYGRARWGASLKSVQAMYPGGAVEWTVDGPQRHAIYRVRQLVSAETALIGFGFGLDGGLRSALIAFPKSGSPVTLEADGGFSYEVTTPDEADQIAERVQSALMLKYGKPASAWANPSEDTATLLREPVMVMRWLPATHTCIELTKWFRAGKGGDGGYSLRTAVMLMYHDCLAESLDGL